MVKFKEFYEVVEKDNEGKIIRKNNIPLIIDCVYESRKPYKNKSDDILSKLMNIKNSGGIRYKGNINLKEYKYIVLYTTNQDENWQDNIDAATGVLTYHGDNKTAGQDIHETKIHGNKILHDIFTFAKNGERKKVPPIFMFEKYGKSDVKFRGLCVPGLVNESKDAWLSAIWANDKDGRKYQNYIAKFTILDLGWLVDNESVQSINCNWLSDLNNEDKELTFQSKYTPVVWREWIETGKIHALKRKMN